MRHFTTYLMLIALLIPAMQGTAQSISSSALIEGTYISSVPSMAKVLGLEPGERAVRYDEMVEYLEAIAAASPKAELHKYGTTYENRDLYYLVISSEENLANLDEIRSDIGRLADPRKLDSPDQAKQISESSPGIAWLLYSVHGDELSSTDAALQVAYHLLADTDTETINLLENYVICIDPLQNQDGRERILSMLQQWQGFAPNPDAQSVQHTAFWPWGRGNHFLFDLNRDWFLMANKESRARAELVTNWNPQLVVDSHEMGGYDTYLFPPAREPINRNINPRIRTKWIRTFASDHAAAFDERGWSYYTKEWNDDWYPGYGSSWARYFDAVGILYEQAGVEGTLLKRPDGTTLTYKEAVNHHVVSSLTNLATALNHRQELLYDFYLSRNENVSEFDRDEVKAFYIVPGDNPDRAKKLVGRLMSSGAEVQQADRSFQVNGVEDYWHSEPAGKTFPAGTYIIRLDQPVRSFINAIMEFDPRMVNEALQKERESLLKGEGTTMYEVSTWSMPQAYGLDAYISREFPPTEFALVDSAEDAAGDVEISTPKYGYLFPYEDDSAIDALTDLLELDLVIRVAKKPFSLHGRDYDRGTLLLRLNENPDSVHDQVRDVAESTGAVVFPANSALSASGPDLGGREFQLLEAPRIALITGPGINTTSMASNWYLLDQVLQMQYSILDHHRLSGLDLRKYNVILLPSAGIGTYRDIFDGSAKEKLQTWVSNGGTLISTGTASAFLADSATGMSKVGLRRQSLKKLDDYQETVRREKMAEQVSVDSLSIWESSSLPSQLSKEDAEKSSVEELKKQDEQMRLFMPRGVFMNLQLNEEHWLAFGSPEKIPALLYTSYAYLTKDPVETAGRLSGADELRVSGLLWPEARQRWAETAYVTRESSGKGQIILFAGEPLFRGYTFGTGKLLMNAVLFGPGFGTQTQVPWR
ncbi:MAG: hypothetical protein GF372_04615 [Candidatus Marinimicrobia bacterium]|nr:hypothetical protein [Candidatus Neomarinimicrobiota bacterium]